MDGPRFDHLARALAAAGSRRRLLGALTATPLLGGLLALLDPEDAEGKRRRRRRKQRRRKRQDKAEGKRQRQRGKRACTPKKRATVCAGRCGTVKNRQTCNKRIDCGSCDCDPPCGVCFTCQAGPTTPGTCVVDPAQQGQACGSPGQVCQPDGACACTAHAQCGANAICADGECLACNVCATCTYTTVRTATDAASSGDTIVICPGTYGRPMGTGRVTSIDGKDLTLIGAGTGADGTILDGGDVETFNGVVVLANTETELRHLTVTGSNGSPGIVVTNPTTLTLTGVLVTGNDAGTNTGGGIFNGSKVILNAGTTVMGNSARVGGGIINYVPGTELTLHAGSRVVDNDATESAPGIYNQGTVVANAGSEVEGCVDILPGSGCPA